MITGRFNPERARELLKRYNAVRPYLNCDFYPLTNPDKSDGAALAWQYADGSEGVVFAAARGAYDGDTLELILHNIDESKDYVVADLVKNIDETVTGQTLSKNFRVVFDKLPYCAVYKYTLK